MSTSAPTSSEDMGKKFPDCNIRLEGIPSLRALLEVREHLIHCAMTHRLQDANYPVNLAYLCVSQGEYHILTQAQYPMRTADPGDIPLYPPDASAVQRKVAESQHAIIYRRFHDECNMDQALVHRFVNCLDADRQQELREAMMIYPNCTFLQAWGLAYNKWGASTANDRQANLATLNAEWSPSDGVTALFRRVRKALAYAIAAGSPIPERIAVDATLRLISRSGVYKDAFLAFKRLQVQDYNALVAHFTQAELDNRECSATMGEMGYGMNATDDSVLDDDEATKAFTETLTNFAGQLSEQSRDGTSAMQRLEATVVAMGQQMAMLMQQTTASAQQQQQAATAAALQQQAALAAAMQQQTQQQRAPKQRQPAQPQTQWQMPPYCAPTGMPMQGFPMQQQVPGMQQAPAQQPSKPMNPTKYFANWNYCWTHGYDVADNHTSATCPKPAANHQFMATRQNTLGGSKKAMHKVQFPTAEQQATRQNRRGKSNNGNNNNQQRQPFAQMNGQQFGGYMMYPPQMGFPPNM